MAHDSSDAHSQTHKELIASWLQVRAQLTQKICLEVIVSLLFFHILYQNRISKIEKISDATAPPKKNFLGSLYSILLFKLAKRGGSGYPQALSEVVTL